MALLILKGSAFARHIDHVRATVHAWAHAWQSQNLTRYMSFYSPAFRSGELGYKDWLNKKAQLFQKPVTIRVEISDLWVFIEGNRATARFVQSYQGPNITDTGEKTLLLINTNDKWMIISEKWTPLLSPAPTSEKPTTITHQQTLGPELQPPDQDIQNQKTLHPNEIIVKNIQFHVAENYEEVCLNL
ncbi:MAG: nuclear transport factor 2 family protein, partial [Desulfobacterales bacterium]